MPERDFNADLAVCRSAPPGPWVRRDCMLDEGPRYVGPPGGHGLPVLYSYDPGHAALTFACAAREGWEPAILEVLALREEVARLREEVASLSAHVDWHHYDWSLS